MTTPEQLDRIKRVNELTGQLRQETSRCPASVANGGAIRAAAWKRAAMAANKLVEKGCQDPAKLQAALLTLRGCASSSKIDELAVLAHGSVA